jgi:hypothetical protein
MIRVIFSSLQSPTGTRDLFHIHIYISEQQAAHVHMHVCKETKRGRKCMPKFFREVEIDGDVRGYRPRSGGG